MENPLNLLMFIAGTALLIASVALLVGVICLYRIIVQRPPIVTWSVSSTQPQAQQWTAVASTLEAPKIRRRRAKKPFICVHCHHGLPPEPHHGVVHEEKAYVVYVCEKCGKETELSAEHYSADDATNKAV
jgi:RNase P subunit RPR2